MRTKIERIEAELSVNTSGESIYSVYAYTTDGTSCFLGDYEPRELFAAWRMSRVIIDTFDLYEGSEPLMRI